MPGSPGVPPSPPSVEILPPSSGGPVKRLLPSPGGPEGVPPRLEMVVVPPPLPSSDTGRTGAIGVFGGISKSSSSSKPPVIIMGSPSL